MNRVALIGVFLLLAFVSSPPAFAAGSLAPAATAGCPAEPLFTLASSTGSELMPAATGDANESLGSCNTSADCHDGTAVSCSAGGSRVRCTSRDAICTSSTTVQGSAICWGSDTGFDVANCPACPPSDPPPACEIFNCNSRPDPDAYCNFECNRQCALQGGFCNDIEDRCACALF